MQAILTGVADQRCARVMIGGVNGTAAFEVDVGFLAGDVTNTGAVTASDIAAVKARLSSMVTTGNFRYDLNADGKVDGADVSVVKGRAGRVLP